MMIKTLVLPLCALLGGAAYAAEPAFVSAEQSRVLQILATPPSSSSAITQKELAELHRIEAARTPVQAEQAKADDEDETIFIYRKVIGTGFTAQALPLTAALSERVKHDEGVNTAPAKKGFARVRPYNLDKTLHPVCKTKTKDDSYPSGHTTVGYLQALTLIDILPEQRDAVLARADDYANNRLVCGVHYPTDLAASKVLAYTIHALMTANPHYQQEVAAARLEVRRALGLPLASN